MKFFNCFIIFSLSLTNNAVANEEDLSNNPDYRARCSGMYDKESIPNGVAPSIQIRYDVDSVQDAATIIYEWSDRDKLGVKSREDDNKFYLICSREAINGGYCSDEELDKIIYRNETNYPMVRHTFYSSGEDSSRPIDYEVNKSGYYCAAAVPVPSLPSNVSDEYFIVTVEWRNPYGNLPAADYPKLPFYGFLSLTYLIIGLIWMALSISHRKDILPVQNYISGVIFFLMVEMAFNWGYWEDYNKKGYSSTILLGLVAVLNAGRNSISFFMLLIVCMGYGVVKPTLGSTMNKCRALAATHFVFGVIYASGTMSLNPDGNPLVLLVIFPLALTMTSFYIWTLQSITNTLQTLEIRKQNVKSLMYKRLYRLLVFSVTILGIFFLINMFNYIHREDPDWIPRYWRWRWFLLDGWLNILYLIVFVVILIIWRPTKNNKRFAMSEELTQYDEDYDLEISNLRAMDNLGYDNVKYRSPGGGERTSVEHNETDRLNENNDESTIFDIGDIDDDESYTDGTPRNSTSNTKLNEDNSKNITTDNTNKSTKLDAIEEEKSTANDNDNEKNHIEQELSKIN